MLKKVFLGFFFFSFLFLTICCNSPMSPDNTEIPYYCPKIKVVYQRDPSKITFPLGNDKAVDIYYELFDPDPRLRSPNDYEIIGGYYRSGVVDMEQIGKHTFVGYLEYVFVQTKEWHKHHKVYVRDYKVGDGISEVSAYTPYGITIERAYDTYISGYYLCFKISQ